MMEAGDVKPCFNMNPRLNMNLKDNKRDTSALLPWIQQVLICFRSRLRHAKSGGLGCLVGGWRVLFGIKKAARCNKPLFENL